MPATSSPPTTLLRVTLHTDRPISLDLPLTIDSAWAQLLGRFPLPGVGALHTLTNALESSSTPPTRADITGPAASALLPLLCIQTTLPRETLTTTLGWSPVDPPYSADPREGHAARLACQLADKLECAWPDAARTHWSIDPARLGSAPALTTIDDALALFGSWSDTAPGPVTPTTPAEWNAAMRAALQSCAERGLTRVALYGAGTHTRALGDALRDPPVEILAIIDDHPPTAPIPGATPRLWGYPVLPPGEAMALTLDAVILSANSMEDRLWAAAAPFRERGIRVIRLYARSGE
jgi:hypothetical protein